MFPIAATSASPRSWTRSPHWALDHGFENVATGTNADDALYPHRPGIRAGRERGVHTPLLDTGLSKADVRRLSRHWSLPTWNKPATPCLASRIRYGIEVTPHRLTRIDRAESALRAPDGEGEAEVGVEPCLPAPKP
ncbi:hypothetical protein [Streptomyces sp. Go-475]|uniref:hypothetical protein n=1 Tax=Streptomyces sp. Go-475 TaxID=2072505 RepID=UPI000DF0253F|nr:hypothetical protein [Streptomyces sp. Go-475]AXE90408.1 hypothetical protein C1703_35795 [Streptomyces sp. Go-475]